MFNRRQTMGALAAVSLLTAAALPATAEMKHGGIMVDAPFARASASPAVKSGAAYFTLHNHGEMADRLIAVEGDAAARIELHTHVMKDGAMQMLEIEGGVPVGPGESVAFEPGGNHVMMMGLAAPLKEGETLPLTLVFEHAGKVAVQVPILGVGAMGGMSHGDHSGHKMTE